MKRIVSICLTALFATSVHAQADQSQQERTTLYVDVAVERQETVAGPYARYAQKYLGVAAPLADKVLHKVTDVYIQNNSDTEHYLHDPNGYAPPSHMNPAEGFPRLTVDKSSAAPVSLEESARLAAEKIFDIRRSRFDLITGEVGENVFGGGLGAALSELSRLEEEYLSLFLGRQTIKTDHERYRVTPVRGRSTYTVCRFSDADGLLPEDDLSGEPMVLELRPIDEQAEALNPQPKPSSRAVATLIPADVQCRIILNGTELASEMFSIRQLGQTVYIER
jgi:hypothetical protein